MSFRAGIERVVPLLCAILAACTCERTPRSQNRLADLVFLGASVYKVSDDRSWAEAVAVRDGIIVFVGSNREAKAHVGAHTQVIELDGAMLLPGFHDVHMHPLEAGSPVATACQLDPDVEELESYIDVLRACAARQRETEWVMGGGHLLATLLESRELPRAVLDAAIPDRPAVMLEETSHSVWANSLALERAGVDRDTPDPPGGVFVKEPATGELSGVLLDAAGERMMDLAWQPTDTVKELDYAGLLDALEDINRHGITSVCDARTYWKRGFHEAWLRAEAADALTVRAILGLWAYPDMDDAQQLRQLASLYRNQEGRFLRISQIKLYADGIIGNTTAATKHPYVQTVAGVSSTKGLEYFSQERMQRYLSRLAPLGFDFHIHAVGDRAVHQALDAIEHAKPARGRHRLTHLELVDPADLGRFRALDVAADVQVAGSFAQPENWHENARVLGDRARTLIPLRDLHDSGARVTLSSDWDVGPLNPLIGIQNALTRRPQHLPDLHAALRAYTIDAAYVMRQEQRVGSIEVGKLADLVVLDRNLFDLRPEDIASANVLFTVLQGEIVYRH